MVSNNVIEKLSTYKSWVKNNLKLLNIAGYIIMFIFCLSMCNRNKDDTKYQQNISALTDSLRQETLKNGNLQYSINGFIATEKELKSLNKDLYDKVKNQDGKIISLNHTIIVLKQTEDELNSRIDSLYRVLGDVIPVNDNVFYTTWSLKYKYDDNNYDIISGKTTISHNNCKEFKHIDTHLTSMESAIDLTFGQKVEDDKLRVFITSSRQGFSTKSLEGVLIDPNTIPYVKKLIKKRHWFTGFGVGVGTTLGVDVLTMKPAVAVGGTLNYNIYQW